jgi:glutaminyl-peptide cyclotransferase
MGLNQFHRLRHSLVAALVLLVFGMGALSVCQRSASKPAEAADTPHQSSPKTMNTQSNATATTTLDALPVYGVEVLNSYPHDPKAFTQGLCFYNGELYESTGQYAESSLRKVDWQRGTVVKSVKVPSEFFAEGMVVLDNRIYQLTWRENTCFVYDAATFKLLRSHSYYGEGWGLTTDGTHLIMSDGSNMVRFLDKDSLKVQKTLYVTATLGAAQVPVKNLNELEFIDGELYANIWFSDSIARINPQTGKVTSWIDMRSVGTPQDRRDPNNVLNGIAYDPKRKLLLVTGKLWASLYEIRVNATPLAAR